MGGACGHQAGTATATGKGAWICADRSFRRCWTLELKAQWLKDRLPAAASSNACRLKCTEVPGLIFPWINTAAEAKAADEASCGRPSSCRT